MANLAPSDASKYGLSERFAARRGAHRGRTFTTLVVTLLAAVLVFGPNTARADGNETAETSPPSNALALTTPASPAVHRRSTIGMVAGVGLIGTGVALFVAAYVMGHPSEECHTTRDSDKWTVTREGPVQYGPTCTRTTAPDTTLALGGLAAVGAGVPILIWSTRNVPDGPATASAQVVASPRGASLRLTF
jgi:hypothetical protein